MRDARVAVVVALNVALAVASCGGMVRYQVTKTPSADCVIRPNGEFCDEEERLPAPIVETWAIEVLEEETVIYIGEEVWIANGVEGKRTVAKVDRSTQNVCTTTRTRTLTFEFVEDPDVGSRLVGDFDDKVRIEGPDSCGETPFGTRRAFALDGVLGGPL